MKYRKFAGRIPKNLRNFREKRSFFGRHVDVQKGEGVRLLWMHVDLGGGVKTRFSCGRHKWMALSAETMPNGLSFPKVIPSYVGWIGADGSEQPQIGILIIIILIIILLLIIMIIIIHIIILFTIQADTEQNYKYNKN